MISRLILLLSLYLSWRLIKKDVADREGISTAIWIPTLWIGILVSRPLSMWLNFGGGGGDSLEGSPLDRLFYFGMIFAALLVLMRRRVDWSRVISGNWFIFLFYGYFLISIAWAPEPFVSFKRWFKEFGNILMALVILTEVNPQQAIRAVFARCAYLLMPLSIVFIRYFPDLGRRYARGGGLEVVGVTTQKNSLGILVVVCGLVLIWDWIERTEPGATVRGKVERYLPFGFVLIGAYLLYLCNSATSILCLLLGGGILVAPRVPGLRTRVAGIGFLVLGGILGFFLLDWMFQIKGAVLQMFGRDASLTGRTAVWDWLLSLKIDPLFGTGFCSFWSDERYLSLIPVDSGIAMSAHNGYLEVYIDGGYVALLILALMLLAVGSRINRHLALGENYALFRFAVFVAMLVGDVSESHWGRMSPLGFMFLVAAIGFVGSSFVVQPAGPPASATDLTGRKVLVPSGAPVGAINH